MNVWENLQYIFPKKGSKAVRSFSKNASIWWVEASLSWDVTSSLCQKKKWNFASETWGHLERGMETPENNFQIYRPINDPWRAVCSLERGYRWGNIQKSFLGDNFWLECPTDLRSTPLSYIFNALFRDTPLGYTFCAQPNSQIAKYPNIWLIWLFGYLAACDKHARVGYPWKEH